MRRIGIVTGLIMEAEILRRAARGTAAAERIFIRAAGPGRARAKSAAAALVDEGAEIVLSMGLAGGLDPALATGDAVIADAVADGAGRRLETDPDLRGAVFEALAGAETGAARRVAGTLAEAAAPAVTKAAKQALAAQTAACAVDMESVGAAEAALAAGVPFLAVRVIADPADQDIPPAALSGMNADGSVSALPVALAALGSPAILPDLLRLARQSRRAGRVLGGLGQVLFRSRRL